MYQVIVLECHFGSQAYFCLRSEYEIVYMGGSFFSWFSLGGISSTEKLLVLLRDGRKLLGILRSFDQFGRFLSLFLIFKVLL